MLRATASSFLRIAPAMALAITLAASTTFARVVFGPPALLDPAAAADTVNDSFPDVATDGTGTWIALWSVAGFTGGPLGSDRDILFARSTDGGMAWSAPAPLDAAAAGDVGNDESPRLASDGTVWVAVWSGTDALGGAAGTDADVLVARSTNGGLTWTPPALLDPAGSADVADDLDPIVVTDGAGTWIAAWTTVNHPVYGTDYDILVARSLDGGTTWSSPVPLKPSAATDTAIDFDPAIATDGSANWVAVWWSEDTLGGTIGADGDILFARSSDGGVTWTPSTALNTDAAADTDEDSRPDVVTDRTGNWVATWATFPSMIRSARSVNAGATWTAPLVIESASNVNSNLDLETDRDGTWLAIWDRFGAVGDVTGPEPDIWMSRSTDAGASWTPSIVLNADASTDGFVYDFTPRVAADLTGSWVAVWTNRVDQFSEADIRVARGSSPCTLTARSGCRLPVRPHKASIVLTDKAPDTKDRLAWRWVTGAATSVADFGTPTTTDDYGFCIYDGTATLLLAAAAPAAGTCGATPCWRALGSGFTYKDAALTPHGVFKMVLQAGEASVARITVGTKGANVPLPRLGSLPLPVRVQLQAANGNCWEAVYGTATANTATQFKAKAD